MIDKLGDSVIFNINGTSKERLVAVMRLAVGFPASGYSITKVNDVSTFVLYRYTQTTAAIPFPSLLGPEECAMIAYKWLESAEKPVPPDHDGYNKMGWVAYTGVWGTLLATTILRSLLLVRPGLCLADNLFTML